MRWLILITMILNAAPVFAQEVDTAKEEEIALRAKRRLYPGGPDENDLRVQTSMPKPVRKISPVAEEEKPETSED